MRDLWRTWLRNRHESKQWNELVLGQPAFWTGEPTLWYCCIDRQWSYIVYLPRGDKYFSISCVSNVEIIALEEFFSRVDKMLKRKKGEKERESLCKIISSKDMFLWCGTRGKHPLVFVYRRHLSPHFRSMCDLSDPSRGQTWRKWNASILSEAVQGFSDFFHGGRTHMEIRKARSRRYEKLWAD